jgi:hypothetical protein
MKKKQINVSILMLMASQGALANPGQLQTIPEDAELVINAIGNNHSNPPSDGGYATLEEAYQSQPKPMPRQKPQQKPQPMPRQKPPATTQNHADVAGENIYNTLESTDSDYASLEFDKPESDYASLEFDEMNQSNSDSAYGSAHDIHDQPKKRIHEYEDLDDLPTNSAHSNPAPDGGYLRPEEAYNPNPRPMPGRKLPPTPQYHADVEVENIYNTLEVNKPASDYDTLDFDGMNKPNADSNISRTHIYEDIDKVYASDTHLSSVADNSLPRFNEADNFLMMDYLDIKSSWFQRFKSKLRKFGSAGIFKALGIISTPADVIGSSVTLANSAQGMNAARGQIDKMNQRTNVIFDATVLGTSALGAAGLALEFASVAPFVGAAGPIGVASIVVGAAIIAVPYALEYRATKLNDTANIGLKNFELYNRAQASKDQLLDTFVNPSNLKKGFLAFNQLDNSITIEAIDVTGNDIKITAKNALHFKDAKQDQWHSADSTFKNAHWNDLNKHQLTPGQSGVKVSDSKPYNTIEDYSAYQNKELASHFRGYEDTYQDTLKDKPIKGMWLPIIQREYVNYKAGLISTKANGSLTQNRQLGININRTFEQAMGYKRAIHIKEEHPLDKSFYTNNADLETPVSVTLPNRDFYIGHMLPVVKGHTKAVYFDSIHYKLAGQNNQKLYHIDSYFFNTSFEIEPRAQENQVKSKMTLSGQGRFVLELDKVNQDGGNALHIDTDLLERRKIITLRHNERQLQIDLSQLEAGAKLFIQVNGSMQKLFGVKESGINIVDKPQRGFDLLKRLARLLMQDTQIDVETKAIKKLEERPLTLMLTNDTWEMGRVLVKLIDGKSFHADFRNEATSEFRLTHSLKEIESIAFISDKDGFSEQDYQQNILTQKMMLDYLGDASRTAHLCVNLEESGQWRSALSAKINPCGRSSLYNNHIGPANFDKKIDGKYYQSDVFQMNHPDTAPDDYRTIHLWNINKDKKKYQMYLTVTYFYQEKLHSLAMDHKILGNQGYGMTNSFTGNIAPLHDGSRIQLMIPKGAELKTLKLSTYFKTNQSIDLLEEHSFNEETNYVTAELKFSGIFNKKASFIIDQKQSMDDIVEMKSNESKNIRERFRRNTK